MSKAIDAAAQSAKLSEGRLGDILNRWQTRAEGHSVGVGGLGCGSRVRRHRPATDDAKRWSGWGTALKPACERWVLARKPLRGPSQRTFVAHGVGALNVDGCRVEAGPHIARERRRPGNALRSQKQVRSLSLTTLGRWPSNVVLSHAETCGDECDEACPVRGWMSRAGLRKQRVGRLAVHSGSKHAIRRGAAIAGVVTRMTAAARRGSSRSSIRSATSGKAKSSNQRGGRENRHPTVKNVDLMRWLVRLITPRGGLVLDAFGGSGTTGVAALFRRMFVRRSGSRQSESHAFAQAARGGRARRDDRSG